ncbi:MAG: FAD-dependent oxidoreductase, partial [Candidatus Altiarchaeota archaeon]|nr:FAD-dependent oxidoreductase [Candidatus Altiarchaeota archaeon]
MIDETKITRAILENAFKDILDSLDIDVAIAGGGPAGLVAARYLADGGASVSLFERKLSVGGGMWGGRMMFPKI